MLAFAHMSLTRAQVEAVAALANLELEPAEIELFARQLGDVLTHVDDLQQVDTTGVSPTTSSYGVSPSGVERPDEVRPSLAIADVLANAPEADKAPRDGGFFKVPKVIG